MDRIWRVTSESLHNRCAACAISYATFAWATGSEHWTVCPPQSCSVAADELDRLRGPESAGVSNSVVATRANTSALFAAMNIATGEVLTDLRKGHVGADVLAH